MNKPDQPWLTEPNYAHWVNEQTGLQCILSRHPNALFWAGYVGVDANNPLYQKDYCTVEIGSMWVHKGLTNSSFGLPHMWDCQDVQMLEDKGLWYFGFDAGHLFDYQPHRADSRPPMSCETYRTYEYMRENCNALALKIFEESKK